MERGFDSPTGCHTKNALKHIDDTTNIEQRLDAHNDGKNILLHMRDLGNSSMGWEARMHHATS